MSETLIERVIAAKQAAEASFVGQIPHGYPPSEAQQAAILIAQVNEIIKGEDEEAPTEAEVES